VTSSSACRWRRPLLAAGLVVVGSLASDPAFAQAPPPTKPGWSFYVSAEGTFESNPNFQIPPNDPSDFSGSGGGGFAYDHSAPRGNISLTGDGRALFYRELTDLNTKTFGGTLIGNYRPGPKTELTFNGSVASDYARRSQLLVEQGLVLGQVQVLTTRLNGALSRVVSTRSTLALSGRFEEAKFDSNVLLDGKTMGGSVVLSYRVKPTTSFSLDYSFDQTDSAALRRQIHTGSAGIAHAMGPRKDLNIKLGASSFPDDIGGRQIAPYGAAAFNLKYQHTTLTFAFTHEVRQEYGVARLRQADLASTSLTRTFGPRRATFIASLAYGLNRSPSESLQDFRYTTYGASAGLKLPLGRTLRLDGGYSYSRSSQVDTPLESHSVVVSLAYRFEPR
jgi:opacity protein-like surface antigen